MNKKIAGPLTLSEDLLCKKEVLGKTFEAVIGGINVYISFPLCPEIDAENPQIGICNPLLPPVIGQSWHRGDYCLDWGCPLQYPSCNSSVALLAVSFDCDENSIDTSAKQLYDAIGKWEHAFMDFLSLDMKHGVERNKSIRRKACNLELLVAGKYIPKHITGTLYGRLREEDEFASIDNIKNAIAFANLGKEFKLEYQMLLSSYAAKSYNRNRQAIVDACAAVEICLVNNIKKFSKATGKDYEKLLSENKSLGDRFALLKQLDNSLGKTDYQKLVVRPRNRVLHNYDISPTDRITDMVIENVEKCMAHYHTGYYDS